MFSSILGPRVCFTFNNIFKTQVRFAGHSKWSNIRHIKGAKDAQRSKLTVLYCHRMQVAIQERSGDNNPDSNIKLKKIVSEAYSAGIPKASLQNTLKNFKDLEKVEVKFEVSSGGGVALLLECMAKSRANAEFEVYGTLKRKGGKLERQLKTKFNRKGIIMAEVKKEAVSLLEDDAIEAGAEEVELINEEELVAEFITGVNELNDVKENLEGRGYKCIDSSLVYIPELPVSPNTLETKAALSLKEAFEKLDSVMAVHLNF